MDAAYSHPGTEPTIVVADDELLLLDMLTLMLTRSGFRVVTAPDGKQALQRAIENRPCLVLTDMMMPEMNGADLCRQLKSREETRSTPVVIMSSLPRQSIPDCGADRYIAKPFAFPDVVACVCGMFR